MIYISMTVMYHPLLVEFQAFNVQLHIQTAIINSVEDLLIVHNTVKSASHYYKRVNHYSNIGNKVFCSKLQWI